MAQKQNNELPIPISASQDKRQTARHLPNFFRTNANKKFLGGTMDVITQPGTLTRISSYVGRRDIPNYDFDDTYIQETSTPRQYYQLEPAFVNENSVTGEVNWYADYIDYMNSLKYFGADTANHSKFNKQEAYTWQPHIDWDKFVNYREYYWLPNGPNPIEIYGEIEKTNSEFTITTQNQDDNVAYIFTPDGLTANPRLTLYRGLTYTFKINAPNKPFAIKTQLKTGDSWFYDIGLSSDVTDGRVRNIEQGKLIWTIPYEAPDMLYYVDNKDIETAGIIDIRDIEESAQLDVEQEIVGKRNFTSSTGIEFINGLVIKFVGQITPEKYLDGYWYVEGVGDRIKFIKTTELEAPATFIDSFDIPFDEYSFDSMPWDNADNFPNQQDYIVVNRSSRDRNNWARNNRWFHRNVLETSALANNTVAELDQTARAKRPILEFEPNIKLYNHGWSSKADIDLVDTVTTDVFSIIEGSSGYNVDGEDLLPGYRIIFTADPDILVRNKIFEVKQILNTYVNANEDITVISTKSGTNVITVTTTQYLKVGMSVRFTGDVVGGVDAGVTYYVAASNFTPTTFSVSLSPQPGALVPLTDSSILTMKVSNVGTGVTRRKKQITLQEIPNSDLTDGDIVYITKGKTYKGSSFYYKDGGWILAQKKTKVNQPPLFDLFDDDLESYSDTTKYPYNTFKGNKIFNYKVGTGADDLYLGFPIIYREITNIGDIEFEFDLQKQSWTYTLNNQLENVESFSSYLRKWTDTDQFEYSNGWVRTDRDTEQNVVRILKIENPTALVPIDVYDEATTLYSIEQANFISSGDTFYICKSDSYGRDLSDDAYWIPFVYKDRYKKDWNSKTEYLQDDIIRYDGLFYTCIVDPGDSPVNRLPTNVNYWKPLYQGSSTRAFHGYVSKGEYTRLGEYFVDDIVPYNAENYIVIKDVPSGVVPTNINYFKKLAKGVTYWQGEYSSQTVYSSKSIISYGIYLYLSKTDGNQGNDPTDQMYWTLLAAGSLYPEFYNSTIFYRPGDIVVKDTRPKLDYRIRVYLNDEKQNNLKLEVVEGIAYINFGKELSVGDKVVYKIRSVANKNVRGYYEIPVNWQNNPLNENVDNFTFGEVVDHVKTIVENSSEFAGTYPGISNLNNLGQVSQFGRKFMQHTGPLSLSSFLMVDRSANIIKSLKWAAKEYSEFKRDILNRATITAFEGTTGEILDQLLLDFTKDSYQEKSAFYYSDMVPFGAASIRKYEVTDYRFPVFVIDSIFDPRQQTRRNILVYVNDTQLLYGKDYEFNTEEAFVIIKHSLSNGDQITIKDYSTTEGCYVPFTPSKLGLYPLYEPMIYIDDTYREITTNSDGTETSDIASVKVIQGHDGSIMKAFDDYRDDILLELERRMFNSVRVDYDSEIFDLNDIIPGYYRRSDFTKSEVNDILLGQFLKWNSVPKFDFNAKEIQIIGESSPRFKFVDGDSFTYNYNNSLSPSGNENLYGYWRGVYKYFFDTDRPHTHPWEMQGFTIKPIWWDDVYGVAPYTSDNKIMWDNIENGFIADPLNRRTNLQYARPGLGKYIPVDDAGKLLSPLDSGLALGFAKVNANSRFAFGDQAPVETVWRRSSEYPYAIMILACVLRGSEFIGKMWDRFTIKRNVVGQIYSTITKKRVSPNSLPYANEKQDDGSRTITSGLANFIDEYVFIQKNINYDYYKVLLKFLNVKLAHRLGGFSSKEKIKVLLDSRSPNSSGSIFLPSENYKLFYNKSAPVETVSYSGVIIEKLGKEAGYRIDGYDVDTNSFEIFPPRYTADDPSFNVGGVSEEFLDWTIDKYYTPGQIVRYESEFYRAKIGHTSGKKFSIDNTKWQRLPFLPTKGGKDAIRRTRFKEVPVRVPYGTVFSDIQAVVDFLLGYEQRLKDWGFEFDEFSTDLQLPLNWLTSAKEFMFWTLQNWAGGSLITLSPAANNLKFSPKINASVDNLDSDFYEYAIFRADGQPLKTDLTDIYREDNGFQIKPSSGTRDGIYHVRSSLVYREHVILFDNTSIFGDVVYDVVPGYRQGRVKLVGFKTNQWDGSYFTPGFMFDNAVIFEWQPYVDYNMGDIVKYQNYYYTALNKVLGESTFDYNKWKKLDEKPEQSLVSNFDYRIEEFRDYYSLESSNFSGDQQELARHLTGYQQRQYLDNIIVDDVSQYKFYQGFIREKGTLNSVTKLFDALRASGFSSIDIKEEYAFKVGDFGASDAYNELEFPLDELKVINNPQDIALTIAPDNTLDPTTYNIVSRSITKKNIDYDAKPFKLKNLDHDQDDYGLFKYKVAGYVNPEDADIVLFDEDTLLNYNLADIKHKDKIWIGNMPNGSWDVKEYYNTKIFITSWERVGSYIRLYCDEIPRNISSGDIIGVKNINFVEGIYKVQRTWNNVIEVFTYNQYLAENKTDSTTGILFVFYSVRYPTTAEIDVDRYSDIKIQGEKLWIDRDSENKWKVLENKDVFTESTLNPPSFVRNSDQLYGQEIKISENNKFMAVAVPGSDSGKVIIYTRPNNKSSWTFVQTIVMPKDFSSITGLEKFGTSVDISPDGKLLVIGAPDVSRVKSTFRGEFNSLITYELNDVVRYENKLWRKVRYSADGGTTETISTGVIDGGTSSSPVDPLNYIDGGNSLETEVTTIGGSTDWVLASEIYETYYSGTPTIYDRQGAVFVYRYDQNSRRYFERDTIVEQNREKEQVVCSYDPGSNERFGSKVKLIQEGSEYWLYITSSGYNNGAGRVQVFRRLASGQWNYNVDQIYLNFDNVLEGAPNPAPLIGNQFGYDITANHGDNKIVISSPFRDLGAGEVYIFQKIDTKFELIQTINDSSFVSGATQNLNGYDARLHTGDLFGYSIRMNGNDLFVSVPNDDNNMTNLGSIYHFIYNGNDSSINPYRLEKILYPPVFVQNERLGTKIDINNEGNILVVSSVGGSVVLDTNFDTYSDRLSFTQDSTRNYALDPTSVELIPTIFDAGSTKFFDKIPYTGAVYVFNKFDTDFIYGDKLSPDELLRTDDNFGSGIAISDDCIVVGAPKRESKDERYGVVYVFDYNELSWSVKASQSAMVDISKFKKAFIYNTEKNVLVNDLDFIDPAKGRIPSIAEQEIKYQTHYDPAIYQYAAPDTGISVDQNQPWSDDHIGELWWDLSTIKYTWYEQGSSNYRNINWGSLFPGSIVNVYEWVETTYLPSQWLDMSGTNAGNAANISGVPKDIDDFTYSTKIKYDPVSQVRTTLYYYWVSNTRTVPRHSVVHRTTSAYDVSRFILDPKSLGYKYLAITNENSISAVNIAPDLVDTDISLNIQFYSIDNTDLLVHREYALLAEDDANTIIPPIIETKWFDSLVGYNIKGQPVPDTRLGVRQRYGSSFEPRQSWFTNRFEALKQYIEYLNSILAKNQVVDEVNFINLLDQDPVPDIGTGDIDEIVDILDELRFVGTSKLSTAELVPVIVEGKILSVTIKNAGYGYKIPPRIRILGTGTGAVLNAVLDTQGRIKSVNVIKTGKYYDSYSTELKVRNYSVLVLSDEEALGGWSIHDWSGVKKKWNRIRTQSYSVPRYWNFIDWYATGFSSDSEVSYQVERTVDLNGLLANIGDVVKVSNVGGAWLLLQRKFTTNDPDFTVDYIVVGKQNATIEFSDKLYNLNKDLGFDTKFSFDLNLYDQTPTKELRIILGAVKNDILIDDLRIEYIKLFFNSVHYALYEHLYVDWVFKTSFLKINHNVGTLKQRKTFQSDELPSYQQYIEEVKPYKSKIREFVSSYNAIDISYDQVTDFDLFSYYNSSSGALERTIPGSANISTYPWKSWLDNYTYELTDIEIYDQGNGYISVPSVQIIGDGYGAKATAYIANSKVYKIVIDNPGTGFTKAPTINISGGRLKDTGIQATAFASIGNSKVRTLALNMKYDRIEFKDSVTDYRFRDTFTGTGSQTKFKLTYACDIYKVNVNILVNDLEIYGSAYDISIVESLHDTYTALEGYIVFKTAPVKGSRIVIEYLKNIQLLNAPDRINLYYNPSEGMYGKDYSQLMTGIDYGGVQHVSIDFDIGGGWDVLEWDITSWDNVVTTNDDFVVVSDGTTRTFDLPYVPAAGEVINVYLTYDTTTSDDETVWPTGHGLGTVKRNSYGGVIQKTIRIDDPYYDQYDGSTEQENGQYTAEPNIIMNSFVGDGINKTITLPTQWYNFITGETKIFDILSTDTITFRKSTSEGTVLPTDRSLIDSFISGGDLTYATARGIAAEEIIIDGDGLITTDTSHGPEELVQGHIVDSLEINVYHTPAAGGPNVIVQNYTGDGVTDTFDIGRRISTIDGVMVLTNGVIVPNVEDSSLPQNDTAFVINFVASEVTITPAPSFGDKVVVISIDTAGYDITEKVAFVGDGSSSEFLTGARYNGGDVSGFVTINGVASEFTLVENKNVIPVPFDRIVVGRRYRIVETGTSDFKKIGASDNAPDVVFEATSTDISGTGIIAYDVEGNTIVRFTIAPADGDIIQIMLFNGLVQKWSEVQTEYIPIDAEYKAPYDPNQLYQIGDRVTFNNEFYIAITETINNDPLSTLHWEFYSKDQTKYEYSLSRLPANIGPASAMAFVVVDNDFLQAPDYENFVYSGIPLQITDLRYPPLSLQRGDILVYKNGYQLTEIKDWTLDSTQSIINIVPGVAVNGDEITVEILKNADFRIDTKSWNWDGSTIIKPSVVINPGKYQLISQKLMRVTTFTNHDIIRIKDVNEGFKFVTGYDVQQYDIIQFDLTSTAINTSGIFDLPRTVSDTSGVFVALSRHLLSPNVDYVVLDNRRQIKVLLPDILTGKDYIQIITFSDKTVLPSYGFKMFKDMMNRYSYKRLDTESNAALAQDLLYFDTQILVKNGSYLTEPNKQNNSPGVIEVDCERIEYFAKEYDQDRNVWVLSQLRRGIVGTGVKGALYTGGVDFYPVGTEVVDIGPKQTVPYTDTELKFTFRGDKTTQVFEVNFVPSVAHGTIEDDSTIASDWYRDTIPWNYGQCDEIEVFVGGRRLSKNPYTVYDQELGQDSYKGAGDKLVEAEFSVDGINHGTEKDPVGWIRITNPPEVGELVVIVRRVGKLWQKIDENASLVYSSTDIARFLRAKTVILPK